MSYTDQIKIGDLVAWTRGSRTNWQGRVLSVIPPGVVGETLLPTGTPKARIFFEPGPRNVYRLLVGVVKNPKTGFVHYYAPWLAKVTRVEEGDK